MHITLKQLKAFRAVASLGQVRLAAQQLNLSQPATSMAIAELEHQLGSQLFDRTGNKLLINDQGEQLMPLASELLDRTLEIENLFKEPSHTSSGHLKLGASTTIGNYLLPAFLTELNDEHEQIRTTLDISNTQTIINKMASFELDVACVEGPCLHSDLNVFPWLEDEMLIVCAPHHPFAQKSSIGLAQLKHENWILREPGSGTRKLFDQNIGQKLNQLNIRMELNQAEAIKNLVRAGQGISCLSKLCITKELDRGELATVRISNLSLKRQLSILLHKKKYHSHAMRLLLATLNWKNPEY